jgi:hypothetical protein
VFVFCYTIINKNHHHHVRLIHTQLLTCKSISTCKNNPWCWQVLVFYLCFDFLLSSLSLFQSFDWFFPGFSFPSGQYLAELFEEHQKFEPFMQVLPICSRLLNQGSSFIFLYNLDLFDSFYFFMILVLYMLSNPFPSCL